MTREKYWWLIYRCFTDETLVNTVRFINKIIHGLDQLLKKKVIWDSFHKFWEKKIEHHRYDDTIEFDQSSTSMDELNRVPFSLCEMVPHILWSTYLSFMKCSVYLCDGFMVPFVPAREASALCKNSWDLRFWKPYV